MEQTIPATSSPSANLSDKQLKPEEEEVNDVKSEIKSKESNQQTDLNVKEPKALETDTVELIEDCFGKYFDERGKSYNISRFTWKNRNKIQVQVINYGARITSIKLPDRNNTINDIVLGFDDLAGYIYYKKYFFGATIGRMSGFVKNGTFLIDRKQYWLKSNYFDSPHHINGGRVGLDQVVWTTYVENKKVIMSHISPHLHEGYPGDLFIRITFELSARNEFNISMEAQCTQPTIVNLSNLTFFNLAGHHQGPRELYKHIVTLNCNCFTTQENGMATGEILNVIHTEFDFQIPKQLGKVIGISPKDGFNQNLCVNRGMNQDDCFVARVLHPPSGRMLEIYSNQCGVQFTTANEFGYGIILSMQDLESSNQKLFDQKEKDNSLIAPVLHLFEKVHNNILKNLVVDGNNNFDEIRELIVKIKEHEICNHSKTPPNTPELYVGSFKSLLDLSDFIFTEVQKEYLLNILKVVCDETDEDECMDLKEIVKKILTIAILQEEKKEGAAVIQKQKGSREILYESIKPIKQEEKKKRNVIPPYYKNANQIVGKGKTRYKMHGGIALQTQNYPNCANFSHFPNCVLKPGEIYKHTITYKFWIRAGNPNKWIKRNLNETKQRGF